MVLFGLIGPGYSSPFGCLELCNNPLSFPEKGKVFTCQLDLKDGKSEDEGKN